MKQVKPSKCHSMIREIVEEEIQAREWKEPAMALAVLTPTSVGVAERLLSFQSRLTMIECMMLDKAFGLSEGFFKRLQSICERDYPEE